MPITINDCKFCGETPILFTGDTYFAYCPKCRYHIEGVTRDDAVREWNEMNPTPVGQVQEVLRKEEVNADNN